MWIILGNYDSNWWRIRDPGLTCSAFQLQRALDGYIMTDILPVSSLNTQTISTRVSHNKTFDQIRLDFSFQNVFITTENKGNKEENRLWTGNNFRMHTKDRDEKAMNNSKGSPEVQCWLL